MVRHTGTNNAANIIMKPVSRPLQNPHSSSKINPVQLFLFFTGTNENIVTLFIRICVTV